MHETPDPPTLVHRSRSTHHEILVYQHGTVRYMTFGDTPSSPCQAYLDPQDPQRVVVGYAQVLVAVTAFHARPARVLCLGVGGGMILTALRTVFPHTTVDAVDIDPAVIAAARDWFGLSDIDGRLRLHADDARRFLARAREAGERWDVVLHDVFDDHYTPAHLMTTGFYADATAVLAPQGLVAINSFARGALLVQEDATCDASFAATYRVRIDGSSRVIVGYPAAPDLADVGRNLACHTQALARAGIDGPAVAGHLWRIDRPADAPPPLTDLDCDDSRFEALRRRPQGPPV